MAKDCMRMGTDRKTSFNKARKQDVEETISFMALEDRDWNIRRGRKLEDRNGDSCKNLRYLYIHKTTVK